LQSVLYWARAVNRPLNIKPDVKENDEDDDIGPDFLVNFEKERRKEMFSIPGAGMGLGSGMRDGSTQYAATMRYRSLSNSSAESAQSMDEMDSDYGTLDHGETKALLMDNEEPYSDDDENDDGGASIIDDL
jgi:hypothetical protein